MSFRMHIREIWMEMVKVLMGYEFQVMCVVTGIMELQE